MLSKVLITADNMEFALSVQHGIFPKFDARHNYEDAVSGNTDKNLKYYLLYSGADCVGISGYYVTKEDKESGWLGWFGILPEFRRKGYGTQALNMFFDECRENGLTHARLYTDLSDNYKTIQFYFANDMVGELYSNPNDDTLGIGVLVFSKSLKGADSFKLWGNKNLHLHEQLKKQSEK